MSQQVRAVVARAATVVGSVMIVLAHTKDAARRAMVVIPLLP